MKALVCRELAEDLKALRFEDLTLPALKPDQARVRVRAASVNFPDILMVQGKYQERVFNGEVQQHFQSGPQRR